MLYDRVCQNPACNKPFRASKPTGQCCSWACAGIVAQRRMPVRFWTRVRQCPHGDFCPYCCWPWIAGTNDTGYGYFAVKEGQKWHMRLAHALAWELVNQRRVPEGLQMNHHCDNPPCCSIWHIYAGTRNQNAADRERRGRGQLRKARNPLTTEEVMLARTLYRQGTPMVELTEKLGRTQPTLTALISGQTWAHVPGALSPEELRLIFRAQKQEVSRTRKTTILTEDTVRDIRALAKQGTTYLALAAKFGVSRSHIKNIVKGRTWKHLL